MKNVVLIAACCINTVLIVALGYFLFVFWEPLMNGGFVLLDTKLLESVDSVAYASQIGRLDMVSLLVAYLGLFLIVVTFGGIWYSQHDARNAAGDIADAKAEEVARKQISDYLNSKGFREMILGVMRDDAPFLLKQVAQGANSDDGTLSSDTANAIAQSFNDGNDGKEGDD